MTELRLDETIVDAFVQKLQGLAGVNPGGWSARATLINAQYPDDLQIQAPDNTAFYTGRMQEIALWPSCFVLAGPMTYREEGNHSMLTAMQVRLWIFEREMTGPRISRKLMRQARAVVEVMYDDAPQEMAYVKGSTSVPGPYHIFPLRSQPGPTFQPQGQEEWLGSYLIVFNAEQVEN